MSLSDVIPSIRLKLLSIYNLNVPKISQWRLFTLGHFVLHLVNSHGQLLVWFVYPNIPIHVSVVPV